ncbi:hypothetical protein [Vibrio sp. VB16]|uniref:hypothetical protein n=1 Tax=Vibrio sp. VB16 TaxID=2785746 RepID=UPI00189C748B|nr:hypothetical protein [Vibrio sp. VB16]UGA57761.1 hypothetical protein IUZ65_019955 [Vibrio sp. VB16]
MKIIQILLIFGAIALGYVVPDLVKSISQEAEPISLDKYCMVSTIACQQDGVTITLEHDLAKPLVESMIEVNWEDTTSDTLLLSLQGFEMDMGIAKYQLTKQSSGRYIGNIMLPVCTQDKMTWIGTLTDGNKEVYAAIRMER